jgi:hypothetical protein
VIDKIALAANQLPADAAWLFPEYDFESMSLEEHRRIHPSSVHKSTGVTDVWNAWGPGALPAGTGCKRDHEHVKGDRSGDMSTSWGC